MLSTKNIVETSRVSKTLVPGKQSVKLNSITLAPGYEAGSYNVHLNVEGPEQGADFEGFFMDRSQTGPRHKGQIGRVRLSPFAYKDGTTKTGVKVDRDQSILRGLMSLSKALGKKEILDTVEADTIEEFVSKASTILSGDTFFNVVLGAKTYDKNGYTQYDLCIPNSKDGKYGFESASVKPEDSKLMTFDAAVHVTNPKAAAPVESFEPEPSIESEFNL